jgi:hypothetical protein
MTLDPDKLLGLLADFAREQSVPMPVSRSQIRAMVAEATQLAPRRTEDAPAALFYACACHARVFGKLAARFLDTIARTQAVAVGLELDATELDIVLLRGRISYDAVGWEEVRDAFAAWLRPAGAPPRLSPRKRPR